MNLKDKKVLVTGAGGFIGSHLCEELVSRGAKVTAMIRYTSRADFGNLELVPDAVRDTLTVIAGNLEDAHFVDRAAAGMDAVFHLGALIAIPYSYTAPSSYVRTNVEGTLNVLEAVRRHGIPRVVHTSTSETYGTARYTPIDEEHPMQGQSPYSASKIGADKIAESYFRSFGTPVTTVRPFNTFGPRQSARAVIPAIISQALGQSEIRLGSLTPVRDLTFVKDTARGFALAAEADQAVGQVVNLGAGKGITIGELAKLILGLMGVDREIRHDQERVRPEASEVFELIASAEKARGLIGWEPQVSLREGLEQTISFVRENLGRFKMNRYVV